MKSKAEYAMDDVSWKLERLRDIRAYDEDGETADIIDQIISDAIELVVAYGDRKYQEGFNRGVENVEKYCSEHKHM